MKVNFFLTLVFISIFLGVSKAQECSVFENSQNEAYIEIYRGENADHLLDSLINIGYYTLKIDSTSINPCQYYIKKGKQFKRIYIETNTKNLSHLLTYDQENQQYYTNNIDHLIKQVKDSLLNQGQPFSKITTKTKGYINEFALATIEIENATTRIINDIKFMGYDRVPRFVKRELLKNELIYNDPSIESINNNLNQYRFLTQTSPPKVSFTKDSTILYVYTKKVRQSFINGIIGFETDDEDKLNLQGNVQLSLMNTFNTNERIKVDWKSGLNKSQNLNFETFLPYLFNFNIAYETNLNLTKQDSTFFKLEWRNGLLYQLNPDHFIGANFNLANSNYIKNQNSDFSKSGFGVSYFYQDLQPSELQENKTFIKLSSTLWRRKVNLDTEPSEQTEIIFWIERQQRIFRNHFINSAFHGSNLIQKGEILENDLYQVGGFNTIRGFNQNSILTPAYNTLSLAYRYIPNNKIFFELFSDLALIQDKTNNDTSFLNAYGLGMQFSTNFGWFQLNYALGSTEGSSTGLSEGKVHLGIKSYF